MTWKCRRTSGRVKCGHVNSARHRKCAKCGKPRPKRVQPQHMQALSLSYAHYLAANGGIERCGICGAPPKPSRRLQRDHEHRGTGRARGLLCPRCNWRLATWATPEWLEAAASYLRRTA